MNHDRAAFDPEELTLVEVSFESTTTKRGQVRLKMEVTWKGFLSVAI